MTISKSSTIVMMTVEAVADEITSVHLTIVPFRVSLTGLISSLEINGKLFEPDIREKVNVVELTTKCDV